METSSRRRSVHLPPELIEEILLRLPVKDILRCKLLSKTYYALFKNPSFINKHFVLRQSDQTTYSNILVVLEDTGKVCLLPCQSDVFVPFRAFQSIKVHIIGSCNGLLCGHVPGSHIFVWNPATREHMVLPPKKFQTSSMLQFGFFYDAESDDYKLVNIFCSSFIEFEIWSMRANSWRQINVDPPDLQLNFYYYHMRGKGVFVRGKFYWLACHHDRGIVISYDVANHSIHTMIPSLDDGIETEWIRIGTKMVDFNGTLAFFIPNVSPLEISRRTSSVVNIWVMDDDCKMKSSTWTKVLSVGSLRLPERGKRWPEINYINGKLALTYECSKNIILYDPLTKDQKELPSCDGIVHHSILHSYTESLLTVFT